MVENFLKLGGGLRSVMRAKKGLTTNVIREVSRRPWTSPKFVGDGGLGLRDGLRWLVTLQTQDRPRARKEDLVEHGVGRGFLGQIVNELLGSSGITYTCEKVGRDCARIWIV